MPKVKPRDSFTQHFESTENIIQDHKVGDKITLTVKGTIKSLEEREKTDWEAVDSGDKEQEKAQYTSYEMGLDIDSIEYPYPNEYSKMVEDES